MLRATQSLILTVTLLAQLPADVSACTCAGPRNALEAKASAMVLQGRVVRIEERRIPLPRLDETWEMYREPVEVEVEVERTWNGRSARRTVITTGFGGGDCGIDFAMGVVYLIPVHENGIGELATGICSGVQSVWEARGILADLGPGHRALPTVQSLQSAARGGSRLALLAGHAAASLLVLLFVAAQLGLGDRKRRRRAARF